MIRYRIKQEGDRFYPQERGLWTCGFWQNVIPTGSMRPPWFGTLDAAMDQIKAQATKPTYHRVSLSKLETAP